MGPLDPVYLGTLPTWRIFVKPETCEKRFYKFLASMAKGSSLKEGKRKEKEAKTDQDCYNKKRVEIDRKLGEEDIKEDKKCTALPKRVKRALPSDENCLGDHERDSNTERKKKKKDRDVKTSEPSDSAEDIKCQREGKEKERRRKISRARQMELTANSNLDLACVVSEGFVSVSKEGHLTEKTDDFNSGKKKKKKKEIRGDNYDEKEHSKIKHDTKANETKVDVGEKRKKKKHEGEVNQEINQKGNLEYISDVNNDENRKKKKKRKKELKPEKTLVWLDNESIEKDFDGVEILGSKEAVGEETDIVKKKKKTKSKHQAEQESKPTIHPGVDYLLTWHNDRRNWNFKKVRQVWLLHNMFDQEQVSKINN